MCGIAGLFSHIETTDPKWIKKMTNALAHRGPDDEGFLAVDTKKLKVYQAIGKESKISGIPVETLNGKANLLLGHRRLAIIDLSPAGHQPMSNETEDIWIVYNGEIYNYIELRDELRTFGYSFRTNTDTEVIIKAYERWGVDCVNHFNGMWAFVIYDKRKNILFGSRDRFGVKPFYYYLDNKYFAFASEMKALLTLPFFDIKVNGKSVFKYIVLFAEELEEEGFYRNILELFPSYSFILDLKNLTFRKWKYYNLPYYDKYENFDSDKLKMYAQRVRELIFEAVRKRLRSDVPIGTCLSGGLDSSTIVCVINKLLEKQKIEKIGERQKVFTASYYDRKVDESKWAKIVVDSTSTEWFQTFPNEDELLEDINDLIYYQDIPFGSTSIYAQYRVMKLASENGVKVLLDGQGGDEIFTGYAIYYPLFFMEMIKNGKFLDLFKEFIGLKNSPVSARYVFVQALKISFAKLLSSVRTYIFRKIFYPSTIIANDLYEDNKYLIDDYIEKFPSTFSELIYQYMTSLSLKTLLRYEDRNSMRFSIEARTPFADDIELIEYLFRLPSVYKIHNGWSKFILRETMNGILPEPIRGRKDKIGFQTPESRWLRNKKNWIISIIRENGDLIKDYLDVQKIVKDIRNDKIFDQFSTIWRIINFTLWSSMNKKIKSRKMNL
ncbi:MAG: asparagine synthase (glutamine-hydrolyzing) [candidate division WOR-3 bacterium]